MRKEIKTVLSIVVILAVIVSGLTVWLTIEGRATVLKVLHAGSLELPFSEFERKFEKENPNVDVQRERAGSVETIRKVTDQGRIADVVAVADYALIQSMMIDHKPAYANWWVQFASNKMVIAFTNKSNHEDAINRSNWYEILDMPDVKFGFSNPNDDPCGYRSQIVIQLSELYYGDSGIFDRLIAENTNIRSAESNESYKIIVPATGNLDPTQKIMVRPAEVDLLSALEIGEIDYLFIYQSLAHQQSFSGVRWLELPEEIDLSNASFSSVYQKVSVRLASGQIVEGKPIVYGITIPSNAHNEGLAVSFLKLVLGENGCRVLRGFGQSPIHPGIASEKEDLPEELRIFVR